MKTKQSGMTLMEMLVSLAVLSIMILAATMILTSTRRVVRRGQDSIRTMADVRAIQHRLRADLLALTNTGFLAIMGRPDGNSGVAFTGIGTFRTMVRSGPNKPPAANAATIDFGLTQDGRGVLWRRAWLHTADYPAAEGYSWRSPGYAPDGDCLGWDLATWREPASPRATIAEGILALPPEPTPNLPVQTLADAIALWPYLTEDVKAFKVQWTAGEKLAGILLWYDEGSPQNPDWSDVYPAEQDAAANHWAECNLGERGKPAIYCALWTFKNKAVWPKAIRVVWEFVGSEKQHEIIVKPAAL